MGTEFGDTVIGCAEFIGDTDKDARDFLVADDADDRNAAEHWLEDSLKAGPVKAKDLVVAAGKDGISRSALYRAKKKLGVVDETEGFPRTSTWYWPGSKQRVPPPETDGTTGTAGTTGADQQEHEDHRGTTDDENPQSSQSSHRPTSETTETTARRHLAAVQLVERELGGTVFDEGEQTA